MSNTVIIKPIPGTVPEGFCPKTLQELINSIFADTQFVFESDIKNSFYNYGDTEPTPDNRIFPWLRTIGGAPDRWYVWFMGAWVWPHPVPAGGSAEWLWKGPLTGPGGLDTFDGGDLGAPSDISGPMWEEDPDMRGFFPIGPGTLPSTTVINVNDSGGNELVSLTGDQIAAHYHGIGRRTTPINGIPDANQLILRGWTGNFSVLRQDWTQAPGEAAVAVTSGDLGTTDSLASTISTPTPVNLMPRYRGRYFIQRTGRKMYRAI